MIETAKGIPDFDKNGNLPHKCYEVTLKEIKDKLVNNFPNSKTRESRFECFIKFYIELITNVKSCTNLLIDGSFVTSKQNPRDVDFTIIVDSLKLKEQEKKFLEQKLFEKNEMKQEFIMFEKIVDKGMLNENSLYNLRFYKMGCDFFQIIKYPPTHFLYNEYLDDKKEWIDWWGHKRDGSKKGFLNLIVDYEEDLNE